MNKTIKKIIALMLSVCMCVGIMNGAVYANEVGVTSNTNTQLNEETEETQSWDGTTKSAVYEEDDYRITYTLSSYWKGGYNASIKIDNLGENTIHNWYLVSALNNQVSNIWNAEVYINIDSIYVIKNAGWNQDIVSGGSVEFGFSGNEDFKGFPEVYKIVSNKIEIAEEDYLFEYKIDSDWGTGFNSTVTITNVSGHSIEDWVVEFDYDRTITSIWNGVVESHEGNHYVIRNANYNDDLAINQSISFGFNGRDGSNEIVPTNCKVYAYGLVMNDYNRNNTNHSDIDEDGLPDFYEEAIGSDKNNIDTDEDGLPDGYEVLTLQSHPTKLDTDEDGIYDGQDDYDEDGLTNFEEYKLVINPNDKDTDGDGLSDKSELEYQMNPNDQDTLDDGIIDGDRKFNVEYDGDRSEDSSVIPHLKIELYGSQIDSFNVDRVEEDEQFLNSSIPGYIGNAYDFKVEGTFEEAVLSFEIDDNLWADPEFEPAIYYWNEETQLLEELDNQYIDGNRICVELVHFSKYIVLAKNVYEKEAFYYTIEAPTDEEYMNEKFNISLVLDESGSISSGDYALMKQNCISFVETLTDDDRIAVFTFGSSAKERCSFNTKDYVVNTIANMKQSNGNTALYDGLALAIEEYADYENENSTKVIILLTDGYDNASASKNTLDSVIQSAKEKNIIVYTIGVGSINVNNLTLLGNGTGGSYSSIKNFSNLEAVFDRVISEADLYKDTDNDGISDYHEKKIASGELRNAVGAPVQNGAIMSYLNPDSDEDGIIDGDEIDVRKLLSSDNYYCYLYSNPCMADSDMDGYDDYIESYIGSSVFSKENVIVSSSTGPLKKNTFPEWAEMIASHSWNYIHNLVQEDIVNKYVNITSELTLPVGRADLFNELTYEIWEVKPASYGEEPKTTKALDQLEGYINCNSELFQYGGAVIEDNVFPSPNEEYTITYVNMKNGLILYRFDKKLTDDKPTDVPMVKPNEDEDEDEDEDEKGYDYKYEDIKELDDNDWDIAAAVILLCGTIAEDFLTGGFGITNDFPSLTYAFHLVFN